MTTLTNSPRILYVTPFWPREATGGQLRSLAVLHALQKMGTVEVLILAEDRTNVDLTTDPGCKLERVHIVDLEPRPNQSWRDMLRWTLDPRSHYPNGWRVGAEATQRLLDSLNQFDLVWFFKQRCADAFPNAAWPCSVLDIDDVPSEYERATLQVGGLRDRLLTRRRLFAWRRRERVLDERFTVLTVCSEEDRHYLKRMGLKAPIHIIPNGFDKPQENPVRRPVSPPRIGFIGLFNYFPNKEGIHWFASECWPRIKREVPDARLRLAGPQSEGPLKPVGPDIDGLGWLANPTDEIRTWSLMVIPIRVGGGTRVKIAHGFSQKCPIVSTSLGANGYQVRDGNEMYLADSAEAFSKACIEAIREPEKSAQMAERAWQQFLEKWTWDAIRPMVWAAADECLRLKGRVRWQGVKDPSEPGSASLAPTLESSI